VVTISCVFEALNVSMLLFASSFARLICPSQSGGMPQHLSFLSMAALIPMCLKIFSVACAICGYQYAAMHPAKYTVSAFLEVLYASGAHSSLLAAGLPKGLYSV